MKIRNTLLLLLVLWLVACARPGAPTGGPKDETPPELIDATPPNKSLFFEGRKIALTFDEYIQIKDLSGQLLISPPLKDKPETLLKGKTLNITLKEDLKDSTTYTFSFGKAITDLNEGNEAFGLKYVISTGSYLDSLSFSGELRDAFTAQPVEKYLALLYERNDTIPTDSLPYVAFPAYFAISNEEGKFIFENLRLDTFKLFVLEDKNADYLYNSGVERMAFVTDLVHTDTVPPQSLRVFKEKPNPKFYNAQYKGYGKIDFNFNTKIDSFTIFQWFIEADSLDNISNRLVPDASQDTLTHWFVPAAGGVEFSFLVYVDTLPPDTASVFVRETKKEKFVLKATASSTILPGDTFGFSYNHPISYVNRENVLVYRFDTIPVDFTWHFPPNKPLLSQLIFPRKFGETYTVITPDSTFFDIFGQTTDTIKTIFKTGEKEDFGKWVIDLELDTGHYIVEVLSEKAEVVKREIVHYSKKVIYPFLPAGKYNLRLIVDENANNQWDPGRYLDGKQPEMVHYIEALIEVRANWEIETSWNLKTPKIEIAPSIEATENDNSPAAREAIQSPED